MRHSRILCKATAVIYMLFRLVLVCWFMAASCKLGYSQRPNVLLLCIDDLRPELNCFGANYIHSPNIDRLANNGVRFVHHYVQAPTCGASRFSLLTGQYGGAGNNAIFERAAKLSKSPELVAASFPAYFRAHGYRTVSIGKVSHHPGGRGGPDWNDEKLSEMPNSWDRHVMPVGLWQHPRGAMHGLAFGEIRSESKRMDLFQSAVGADDIYPDGLIADESIRQLDSLTANAEQPYFLAVGLIRPHLPFGAPAEYMEYYRDVSLPPIPHPNKPQGRTTWHGSAEFMKYNRWEMNPLENLEFATDVRKHYAACVSYADTQVGKVLNHLEQLGQSQNTIVILWGDHGWHLGEHAIWGKHALFEESLRSPLIISYPGQRLRGLQLGQIVETVDIFPTVCELAQLPQPELGAGSSLVPLMENSQHNVESDEQSAVSYTASAATIRTLTHRLILHRDGFAELYDHTSEVAETRNLADSNPREVDRLSALLIKRRAGRGGSQ